MKMRWLLLCGIVLAAGPAMANDEAYMLTLAGGLPGERDAELFLDVRDGSVARAFALAPQFNKVVDGSVIGTFSGTFGTEQVAGRLSGEYRRCPSGGRSPRAHHKV